MKTGKRPVSRWRQASRETQTSTRSELPGETQVPPWRGVRGDLDKNSQHRVVAFVNDAWLRGKQERKSYEDAWQDCLKAYNCVFDPIKDPSQMWKSDIYLPWCFDALEAWYAYLHGMLLPKDEEFFSLKGRVRNDDPGAEVMEKYLRHTFNLNGLSEKFGDFLRQLGIYGNSALKLYWREERVMTGRRSERQEVTLLNHAWFDVIPMAQFVFYPLDGDFDKAIKIHETYRYLEEIEAAAETGDTPYFNLDALRERVAGDDVEWAQNDYKGVSLREAWIPRLRIGKTVYHNIVATVADETTLIRFQPNPFDLGKTPFVFCALIPALHQNLGVGILQKALGLQRAGNYLHNARLDEVKLKTYGTFKYTDDGVFNPYNFIVRPGGLTKVGSLENLQPISKDLSGLQVNFQELGALKDEFEEVTVPRIVKGQLDNGDITATEANLADKGASGKMNAMAQRINEKALKPLIELTYLLIYQKLQSDPQVLEDIARVTQPPTVLLETDPCGRTLPSPLEVALPIGAMVQALPRFLPLPEIDAQVIGYQTQIRKQETLSGLERITGELAQTPAAQYIDWLNAGKLAARMLGLSEDEVFVSDAQKRQVDQQSAVMAQQQQAAAAQSQQAMAAQASRDAQDHAAQMRLYAMKEQNQFERTRLEREKLHQKFALDAAEVFHRGVLGGHGGGGRRDGEK